MELNEEKRLRDRVPIGNQMDSTCAHSQVPIKRVEPNKRVGWIFYVILNK